MSHRNRLPNRRYNETFEYCTADGQCYLATIGFDGQKVAELFINSASKLTTTSDINAADGAVAVSLALQYGCPIEVLRDAMKRNQQGEAVGCLGAALDEVTR